MCPATCSLGVWTLTALTAPVESYISDTNCSERLYDVCPEVRTCSFSYRHLFLADFIINVFHKCLLHVFL